jgi:membrane protein YdbS with pleckstrin-like domain
MKIDWRQDIIPITKVIAWAFGVILAIMTVIEVEIHLKPSSFAYWFLIGVLAIFSLATYIVLFFEIPGLWKRRKNRVSDCVVFDDYGIW